MKSTVELIKEGIAGAEKELKEIDKKRDAVVVRIKELRHDMVLLSSGGQAEAQAPPATRGKAAPKGALKDKGEQAGTVKTKWGDYPIFKNVRVLLLSEITSKIPAGEWFRPGAVRSAAAAFYPASTTDHAVRLYLKFLEQLKFVEHNKGVGRGSKYKWQPQFQNQPMTEEEVKKRIEEDRKALQDVLG